MTPQQIGIIGLGAMGRPMARHLLAKGYAVSGCDLAQQACDRAAALGVNQETLRPALGHSSAQNWAMSARAESRPTPWAEKDMNIALKEADAVRKTVPLAGLVRELIRAFKMRRGYPMPKD